LNEKRSKNCSVSSGGNRLTLVPRSNSRTLSWEASSIRAGCCRTRRIRSPSHERVQGRGPRDPQSPNHGALARVVAFDGHAALPGQVAATVQGLPQHFPNCHRRRLEFPAGQGRSVFRSRESSSSRKMRFREASNMPIQFQIFVCARHSVQQELAHANQHVERVRNSWEMSRKKSRLGAGPESAAAGAPPGALAYAPQRSLQLIVVKLQGALQRVDLQVGLHPCIHFFQLERLGDVVDTAALQSFDLVGVSCRALRKDPRICARPASLFSLAADFIPSPLRHVECRAGISSGGRWAAEPAPDGRAGNSPPLVSLADPACRPSAQVGWIIVHHHNAAGSAAAPSSAT